jgi:phosphotransacetylase
MSRRGGRHAPNQEKQPAYCAEAEMAGIVLGARAPIMLTSRADNTLARLGSCAIALILARHRAAQAP